MSFTKTNITATVTRTRTSNGEVSSPQIEAVVSSNVVSATMGAGCPPQACPECPPVPSCPDCPPEIVWVIGESPVGNIDGSNDLFQTNDVFQADSLRVYHNGLKLQWEEIDLDTGDPLFFRLVYIPLEGDVIEVDYIIA